MPESPQLTPDVTVWLLGLVNGLTLNVGADDFDSALEMVLKARKQLQELIQ